MMDWPTEIVTGVIVQQRLAELDTAGVWEHHLPEVGRQDEVAATEQSLGYRLDVRYREFLRYANGWKSFYLNVDLLGTTGLLGGNCHAQRQGATRHGGAGTLLR